MDIFIELDPPKRLFSEVFGISFLCRAKGKPALRETPGYLGGRLHTHTGHASRAIITNSPVPANASRAIITNNPVPARPCVPSGIRAA